MGLRLILMRFCYYIVRLCYYNIVFNGKCCCKNFKITAVDSSMSNKITFGKQSFWRIV